MNRSDIYDGGYRSRAAFGDKIAALAAGTGDATEASGPWVSRDDSAAGMAKSAKLVITWEATLTDTKTLSIGVNIQDATDSSGTGAADYGTAYAAAVVATSDGGGTESGVMEFDFDLSSANEYVRTQITPDLNASGTDVVTIHAAWVFYGGNNTPVTKSLI